MQSGDLEAVLRVSEVTSFIMVIVRACRLFFHFVRIVSGSVKRRGSLSDILLSRGFCLCLSTEWSERQPLKGISRGFSFSGYETRDRDLLEVSLS